MAQLCEKAEAESEREAHKKTEDELTQIRADFSKLKAESVARELEFKVEAVARELKLKQEADAREANLKAEAEARELNLKSEADKLKAEIDVHIKEIGKLKDSDQVLRERLEQVQADYNCSTDDAWDFKSMSSQGSRKGELSKNIVAITGEKRCMITGQVIPGEGGVTAAHIVPVRSAHKMKCEYDVNSAKNGFFVMKPYERAFDTGKICFLEGLNSQLHLCILNEDIEELDHHDPHHPKFSTPKYWHGTPLKTGKHSPSRRLLARHARAALKHAVEVGWITPERRDTLLLRANFRSPPDRKLQAARTFGWVSRGKATPCARCRHSR
jgi:hypothetical protein